MHVCVTSRHPRKVLCMSKHSLLPPRRLGFYRRENISKSAWRNEKRGFRACRQRSVLGILATAKNRCPSQRACSAASHQSNTSTLCRVKPLFFIGGKGCDVPPEDRLDVYVPLFRPLLLYFRCRNANPHHYRCTFSPLLPLATDARQILLPRPFLAGPSRPFQSPLPRQYTVLARNTTGAAALASPLRPSTGSPSHTLALWRPRMASHRKVSLRRRPALGPSSPCFLFCCPLYFYWMQESWCDSTMRPPSAKCWR